MRKRIKAYKTATVVFRGWVSFILALGMIGAFWCFCYWLVARYAGGSIGYFKVGAWTAVILGLVMLVFNEPLVILLMGCKRVRKRSDSPKLWDAVERVTGSLVITPRIYVCPSEGMNAFAFGWGIPFFSAVGATQGIINGLTEEELSAVMAHEAGHIINKDILVSAAMAISVMMMAFTGWLFLRVGPYSRGRSSDSKGKGAAALLVIILVGLLLYVVGRMLGVILQMFVSRQREYAADATSARIIGTSRPLISALTKIIDHPALTNRTTSAAFGFLCTADPDPSDLMSTHPSPEKRFRALEWLEE